MTDKSPSPPTPDEDDELVAKLREHATDWNGKQMPDLEPAKADPTAGTLRAAASRITALKAENSALATALRERDEAREALRETLSVAMRNETGDFVCRARAALSPKEPR